MPGERTIRIIVATAVALLLAGFLHFEAVRINQTTSYGVPGIGTNWSIYSDMKRGTLTTATYCYIGFSLTVPNRQASFCLREYHYFLTRQILRPVGLALLAVLCWIAVFMRPIAGIAAVASSFAAGLMLNAFSPFADGAYYRAAESVYHAPPLSVGDYLLLPSAIDVEMFAAWLVVYLAMFAWRSSNKGYQS